MFCEKLARSGGTWPVHLSIGVLSGGGPAPDESIFDMKNFINAEIIRLEQNYRSTKNILSCASTLISKNDGRYGKELWSKNETGEKISVNVFWETKEESIHVSDNIEKLIKNNIPMSQISILFRVSAHTRPFEERFINLGIPN